MISKRARETKALTLIGGVVSTDAPPNAAWIALWRILLRPLPIDGKTNDRSAA